MEYQSKIVCNGKLKVTTKGEAFRLKDGEWIPAAINYTCRNRRYATTTLYVDGKQRMFYIHRLVAQAFIPNPENKPQVNHKDGNPKNNDVENLEWVTAKENADHARRTGLARVADTPCKHCGKLIDIKTRVCASCRTNIELGNKRRQRKLENIESELDKICVKLKPRDKEIAKMRLQGMTYAEIGERYGVSRQCIHERMRKIINKSEWIRSVLGDKA